MHKSFVIIFMATFSLWSFEARSQSITSGNWDNVTAGGVDGGGGIAVSCPDTDELELLDIHEARLSGLYFSNDPQSKNESMDRVARLFAQHFWNPDTIDMADYIALLRQNAVELIYDGGVVDDGMEVVFGPKLSLSPDVGTYKIKEGCSLEQVAYFDDKAQILKIYKDNWQRLSWLDKAALVTHEIIYLMERTDSLESFANGQKKVTSENTRTFVGRLF
ncbi:MAG: hypothetical protein HRT44_04465 [Bdellovibrionales bacterium]|nr:hypothetical protein [Bdellovibrionales bacterium]NQZ18497.1 hypothetical protein [Bdellovibrionales bacterium]